MIDVLVGESGYLLKSDDGGSMGDCGEWVVRSEFERPAMFVVGYYEQEGFQAVEFGCTSCVCAPNREIIQIMCERGRGSLRSCESCRPNYIMSGDVCVELIE